MADAVRAILADESALLGELQLRLKKPKGAEPKKEHIAVAVLLARDPALAPGTVWKSAGVPAGGARTRIVEYRDRIANERLLDDCAAVDPSVMSPPHRPALAEQLLVQQRWIGEHAPSLREFAAGPLIFSGDSERATREIVAKIDGSDEPLCGGVSAANRRPGLWSVLTQCPHPCLQRSRTMSRLLIAMPSSTRIGTVGVRRPQFWH